MDPDKAAQAEALSRQWIEYVKDEAGGDLERLMTLLSEHIEFTRQHADRARQTLVETAIQLRDKGVPMKDIAAMTGFSDSYLSRKTIDAGSPRRVDRTYRRGGPPPLPAGEDGQP